VPQPPATFKINVDLVNGKTENSYQKQLMVDNELCLVDLLDTAGQEEYAGNYIRKKSFGRSQFLPPRK